MRSFLSRRRPQSVQSSPVQSGVEERRGGAALTYLAKGRRRRRRDGQKRRTSSVRLVVVTFYPDSCDETGVLHCMFPFFPAQSLFSERNDSTTNAPNSRRPRPSEEILWSKSAFGSSPIFIAPIMDPSRRKRKERKRGVNYVCIPMSAVRQRSSKQKAIEDSKKEPSDDGETFCLSTPHSVWKG